MKGPSWEEARRLEREQRRLEIENMKLDLQLKEQRVKLWPLRLVVFALGVLAMLGWAFVVVARLMT